MSEISGKPSSSSSSLAITEKRPSTTSHRSGGCVGIFFQLFDWNRRLAKKKLFSKKLLPPARAKQSSKKFKGDEKMPTSKLHLISDENKGGFPMMMKKNSKGGVDSDRINYGTRSPSLVARLMGLESLPVTREKPKTGLFSDEKKVVNDSDLNMDRANVKLDSRPQKLQRTEQFERKAVTRFGADSAFQIKNVLSRSRKHYHQNHNHPKFVTPVKSPRVLSGKNVSRTSRLIDAATKILEPGLQSSSKKFALGYQNREPSSGYNADMSDLFMIGQSSCTSCGNFLEGHCGPNVDQDPAVFQPYGSKIPVSRFGQEPEPVFHGGWVAPMSVVTDKKCLPREGQAPWPSSSSSCNFLPDEQKPTGRDRTPPRTSSKPNNVVRGTKDFVTLNRNLSSARTRPRGPTARVESSNRFFPERRGFNGREETPQPPPRSPIRKRRTITNGSSSQAESQGFVSSNTAKQRFTQFDSMNRSSGIRKVDGGARNGNEVISFAFNSPVKQKPGRALAIEKKVDDEIKMLSCRRPSTSALKGDSIAALLEQKLKELTSQDDDELSSPKKSTAVILQELISALTAERPDIALVSNAETKHEKPAGMFNVIDHLSPGSVLEASFSSSSHDDSSGHILYTDSVDYSSDPQVQYFGPDSDILDSAPSSRNEKTSFERVKVLVNTVSRVLDAINLAGGRLTEIGLTHAKQVIVNSELLFGNIHLHRLEGLERLFLGPILLELEAIANIAWANINVLTGSDASKSGNNQYRGFLFDCLIECLDCKYGRYPNSGFRAWTRIPPCIDRETIIGDVENEMKKWTRFVGMFVDEIFDWEMSHGLGKWTDFNTETFEIGSAACDDILEDLVDETLIGLLGVKA